MPDGQDKPATKDIRIEVTVEQFDEIQRACALEERSIAAQGRFLLRQFAEERLAQQAGDAEQVAA
jgi:hypothetical protein